MDECEPEEECLECLDKNVAGGLDGMMDEMLDEEREDAREEKKKGKKGEKGEKGDHLVKDFFKLYEHGQGEDQMKEDMREMGVPEECLDACRPSEDCVECMMAQDWEDLED